MTDHFAFSRPSPPIARRIPKVDVVHGDRGVDDYGGLRRREDPEVVAYLRAENDHADAMMRPTVAFQDALYREMLDRIKEDDQTVPYRFGGHLYYARTEKGSCHCLHEEPLPNDRPRR